MLESFWFLDAQHAEPGEDSRDAARDDGGQGSFYVMLAFLCLLFGQVLSSLRSARRTKVLPWIQAGVLGAPLLVWLAWPGSQQAELGNDSRGAARDDGGQGSSHLVLGFLRLFLDRFSAGRG